MSALPAPARTVPFGGEIESLQPWRVLSADDYDPAKRSGTDENLNFQTHAAGFVVSLAAAPVVIHTAASGGDFWMLLACVGYSIALLAVYGASTLSHAAFSPRYRHLFRTLDQVSIFLLIAATATPFFLAYCRDFWGFAWLTCSWVLALGGVCWKIFIARLALVPVWYYVVVGWVPSTCLLRIASDLGWKGILMTVTSGAAIMLGTWFLVNDHRARWFHAVWHVLVMFGTALQLATIIVFVLP